jgi:ubiquinone/menaquinone biosynthesis C-methylase UbiE
MRYDSPAAVGRSSVEHDIAGGYQLDALLRGWAPQRAWHRARLDLVAHVLRPVDGSLILDAAAGSGIVTWRFPASTIVSADMRVSACQFVRTHTPDARATAGDLCALPFRSGAFAQIYCLEAIEHLSEEDGRAALGELRRVARNGARCLITTPNYHSLWIVLERVLDALQLTPPMTNAQHQSRYDGRSLAAAAQAAGWKVVRSGSFNLAAPVVGMLSARAGAWATGREAHRLHRAGTLLYSVCEAAGR